MSILLEMANNLLEDNDEVITENIYYVKFSDGSTKEIKAESREECLKIAKKRGYQIYKITRAGGKV